MTCSAKVLVLLPCVEGSGTITHKVCKNIPEAVDEVVKLKRKWPKLQHHTPPGEPSIRIVKVVEDIYIGGEG